MEIALFYLLCLVLFGAWALFKSTAHIWILRLFTVVLIMGFAGFLWESLHRGGAAPFSA